MNYSLKCSAPIWISLWSPLPFFFFFSFPISNGDFHFLNLSSILPHTAEGRRDVLCTMQQTTVIHRRKKSMLQTKLLKNFRFGAAALVFGDQNNVSNWITVNCCGMQQPVEMLSPSSNDMLQSFLESREDQYFAESEILLFKKQWWVIKAGSTLFRYWVSGFRSWAAVISVHWGLALWNM